MSGAGDRRRTRGPIGWADDGTARIIPLWHPEIPLAERAEPRRPLIVAADDRSCAAVAAELTGAGWLVTDRDGPATGNACRRYPVRGRADAQAAVVAAVRGDAVLVQLCAGPSAEPDLAAIADDLIEDLAGLGPVLSVDAATTIDLDEDSWRLAHQIAGGATLEAAAKLLHLSTRTANRRLTGVRRALGVDSRAQLVRALTSGGRVPPAGAGR